MNKLSRHIGKVFENRFGYKCEIIDMINGKDGIFTIHHIGSNFNSNVYIQALKKGRWIHYNQPTVCNRGIIHNRKACQEYPREYNLWSGLINRLFNPNRPDYYLYKDITIDERWLICDNFIEDISFIKGYDENLFHNGKLQLDKDISGKNRYSLNTCCFVTNKINSQHRRSTNIIKLTFPDGKEEIGLQPLLAEKYNLNKGSLHNVVTRVDGRDSLFGIKVDFISKYKGEEDDINEE